MARRGGGTAGDQDLAEVEAGLSRAILRAIAESLGKRGLALRPAPEPQDDASETLILFDLEGFRYALVRRRLADDVHLSPREAEIIRLVATGLPNKCIGAVLEISAWTVATHLRRIFAKLGVSSRAAMIARVGGSAMPLGKPSVHGRSSASAGVPAAWTEPKANGASEEQAGSIARTTRGAGRLRIDGVPSPAPAST